MTLNTQLYPYQQEGVGMIRAFDGRTLLADDMGLGKTVQIIGYADAENTFPMLVVCPASLKYNWQNELWNHASVRARVLSGQSPPRSTRKLLRYDAWVINYDVLAHWEDTLAKLPIELLVFDESHFLADPQAKRTRSARRLSKGVPRVIAATGTPIANRPADLWPTLNILRPDEFPTFLSYGRRYCQPKRTPYGITYKGATRLDELNRRLLASCMIRRRKCDVLGQLPAKSRHVVTVEATAMDEYRRASGRLVDWLGGRDRSRSEGLEQVGKLLQLAGRLKLPGVFDWVDSFLAGGEKLIVYAKHHHVIDRLRERYAGCAVVTGKVTGEARQAEFDRFNEDGDCRLFVGQVRAAGAGWNCTSADTVCFAEMDWSPGVLAQAEDRVHGANRGAGGPAAAYYLTAKGTVEEALFRAVQRKSENIAAAVDGGETDMEVYDLLIEEIRKGGGR